MNLSNTDLVVDEIYGGSRKGNASDDPLPKLLGVDSGAGFRHLGKRPNVETLNLIVLKSNFKEPDWPDSLDTEAGIFTYYGDRRSPGELHDTPRKGNMILANLFKATHDPGITEHFPPILLFGNTGTYRDLRFLGLAVPGGKNINQDEDLVAFWRSTGKENIRFQNYRAKFTILDIPIISRKWIKDVQKGNNVNSPHVPKVWLDWVKNRKYNPLCSPHVLEIRKKEQQLPADKTGNEIIKLIYNKYKTNPYEFEKCAIEIARFIMPSIVSIDLTRPWRDGGRDATGLYSIGRGPSAIDVEFALEAKCFKLDSSVTVKHTSRLISRLRHRQFGILVTTSYIANQAYKELKEDDHPVVIVCAKDIVNVMKEKYGSIKNIRDWLNNIN